MGKIIQQTINSYLQFCNRIGENTILAIYPEKVKI